MRDQALANAIRQAEGGLIAALTEHQIDEAIAAGRLNEVRYDEEDDERARAARR